MANETDTPKSQTKLTSSFDIDFSALNLVANLINYFLKKTLDV